MERGHGRGEPRLFRTDVRPHRFDRHDSLGRSGVADDLRRADFTARSRRHTSSARSGGRTDGRRRELNVVDFEPRIRMSSLAVNSLRSTAPTESLEGTAARERCYVCFRPLAACHCAAIPRIENQTPVLLVQHRRESFHPFNTARIVRHGLVNSELVVDQNQRLAARIDLRPGAALLFPGSQARRLDELSPAERPAQLVVVDGTWHQVKTVLRHVPALRELPQYCLAPTRPSNFRIRREPNDQALSTVEAVVAALQILEPETAGLEQLLTVFNLMIDRQLAQPRPVAGRRRLRRPRRTGPFIPPVLIDELERIVVTYCEAEGVPRGVRRDEQRPRYLAAERLVTGSDGSAYYTADHYDSFTKIR